RRAWREQLADQRGALAEALRLGGSGRGQRHPNLCQQPRQRDGEREERSVEIRRVVHVSSCDRLARPLPANGTGAGSEPALQELATTAMILTKLSLSPISARRPCCIVRSGERILRCNSLSGLPGCSWQHW